MNVYTCLSKSVVKGSEANQGLPILGIGAAKACAFDLYDVTSETTCRAVISLAKAALSVVSVAAQATAVWCPAVYGARTKCSLQAISQPQSTSQISLRSVSPSGHFSHGLRLATGESLRVEMGD